VTDQPKTWDNLLLRLQSCAYRECRGHGVVVVSIKLLLRDGDLIGWTQPIPTYTEPRGRGGLQLEGEHFTDAVVDAIAGP